MSDFGQKIYFQTIPVAAQEQQTLKI